MTPLWLSCFTMTSCLGAGLGPTLVALQSDRSGLRPCVFETCDLPTSVGAVAGVDQVCLPQGLVAFDCRNHRLAEMALLQDGFDEAVQHLIARTGRRRIGVFMGTSTSGMLQTELSFRRRDAQGDLPADFRYDTTHNAFSLSAFVRQRYGLEGPAASISSACSSAAKAFGVAQRMIAAGLVDAAIVGGVDSLCLTTLYGFNALNLLSQWPCRPFDCDRDGISIGEAAAYVLVERVPESLDQDAVLLLGVGESSDAYHMSAPHPDGLGARLAMEQALVAAQLEPAAIDYINLHGTATHSNDLAEAKAVHRVFGSQTACSSTKGATGHTLGAAGAVEAVISALALRYGVRPGSAHTERVDPGFGIHYLLRSESAPTDRVLSNSFGFGGSNCSLVLGRAH